METTIPVKKQPMSPSSVPPVSSQADVQRVQQQLPLMSSPNIVTSVNSSDASVVAYSTSMDTEPFAAYRLFGDHSSTHHLQQQQQQQQQQQLHQLQAPSPDLLPDYASGMVVQAGLQLPHQLHHHHQQQQHLTSLYDLPRPEKVPMSTISYLPQPHQLQQSYLQSQVSQLPPPSSTAYQLQPLGDQLTSPVTIATARYPMQLGDSTGVDADADGPTATNSSCSPTSSSASNQTPPAGAGFGRRGAAGARKKPVPNDLKDSRYFERRKRNNAAAKKSRDARKQREDEVAIRASYLEKENSVLRAQLNSLREEVNSLREMLRMQQQQQQSRSSHRDLPVS